MIVEWESLIGPPETGGPAPDAWDPKGTPWRAWREGISDLLSHVLWPRYVKGAGWVGPADKFKHDLTLADFDLFQILRPLLGGDETLPNGKTVPQRKLFVLEDEADAKDDSGAIVLNRSIDASLRLYLADVLEPSAIEAVLSDYLPGLGRTAGNVDLEVKRDMQRPRAYQMAFLLGRDEFTHNHAKSAVTPAMISGHCVEAMMGGVTAWYALERMSPDNKARGQEALARHTVDVGDRRVFGGVHYPSDNISSWLTGLLMCTHVCPDDTGRDWLWQAITRHSRVYSEIAKRAKGSPYELSMDLLEHLANLPRPTVGDAMKFVAGRGSRPIAAE